MLIIQMITLYQSLLVLGVTVEGWSWTQMSLSICWWTEFWKVQDKDKFPNRMGNNIENVEGWVSEMLKGYWIMFGAKHYSLAVCCYAKNSVKGMSNANKWSIYISYYLFILFRGKFRERQYSAFISFSFCFCFIFFILLLIFSVPKKIFFSCIWHV